MINDLIQYCNEVIRGDIIAGELFKKSCMRFLNFLNDDRYYFNNKKYESCINFIKILKHNTGEYSGSSFHLENWERFIIANIVALYNKDGKRVFFQSYIQLARKNGKTALAAAIALFFAIADGEENAEVIFAANSKEQAAIAFSMVRNFVKNLDEKNRYFTVKKDEIIFKGNSSRLRIISSNDRTLDGFNASFGIVDEYHTAQNSNVRNIIKSSMGMRVHPHLLTITTAGFDKTLPCYELRNYAINVINGVVEDNTFFSSIFELDEGDNWYEERNWKKANPNLNITVKEEWVRNQINEAKNNPAEEIPVRVKILNQWVNSHDNWISESFIIENGVSQDIFFEAIKESDFCFVGVDLASVSDLTAVSYLYVVDDLYFFDTQYFLPSASIEIGKNKENYRYWHEKKYLNTTPGNVTDYDFILKKMMERNEDKRIYCAAYDPFNATQFVINCTQVGIRMLPFSQGIGNFNKPTKEIERLILQRKVKFLKNPITDFCFKNAQLKIDTNGNAKPVKSTVEKKIDGVIAIIMALGCYLDIPQFKGKITL